MRAFQPNFHFSLCSIAACNSPVVCFGLCCHVRALWPALSGAEGHLKYLGAFSYAYLLTAIVVYFWPTVSGLRFNCHFITKEGCTYRPAAAAVNSRSAMVFLDLSRVLTFEMELQ